MTKGTDMGEAKAISAIHADDPAEYSQNLLASAFCAVTKNYDRLIALGAPRHEADIQTRHILRFLAECVAAHEYILAIIAKAKEPHAQRMRESLGRNAKRIFEQTMERIGAMSADEAVKQ